MPAYWDHANSLDWWDGPDRFKRVNRCQVAEIQNEAAMRVLDAVVDGPKVDMGGPTVGNPSRWQTCNIRADRGASVVADACASPFEAGQFAVVFSAHTIEHTRDPRAFLSECSRILRPGGLLYVVCPDRAHHRHDLGDMTVGDRCFNEWEPPELLGLFRSVLSYDLLSFDTRRNNFDFELFARKPLR